jgi:hypothetical protein
VQFAQFASPLTPLGGIALTPDGTVYLNANGAFMRYTGSFTQFPYQRPFDSHPFSPLTGINSLATESDGTVITVATVDLTVQAPESAAGPITLSHGQTNENIGDLGADTEASYHLIVPGPYGSAVASMFVCGACPGDQIQIFSPPGTPPIQLICCLTNTTAIRQGTDGMTYIAAVNPGNQQFVPQIFRVDPKTGDILNTVTPAAGSHIVDMAAGPDGNIWFTDSGLNQIGRLTPAGHLTFFNVPTGTLGAITAASDNALWFVDGQNIDRISTNGQQVTSYTVPSSDGNIFDITSGPAGSCIPGKIFFADAQGLGVLTFRT